MTEETNDEQDLANIEREHETARRRRDYLVTRFEVAKAKYHRQLTAERDADGAKKMTIKDMEALETIAVDEVEEVRDAYLELERAEDDLSETRLKVDEARRAYWRKWKQRYQ